MIHHASAPAAVPAAFPPLAPHGVLPDIDRLDELAGAGTPRLRIDRLHAGYGRAEILDGFSLRLGAGQSLCLIGPNGAGKSTVLNAVFGLADVRAGSITIDGHAVAPKLHAAERLARFGLAYVLQESSVFPDLSVEQNLRLGAYLLRDAARVTALVDVVLTRHPRLAERRHAQARVLSGGERRLLEISRAPMLRPRLLLIDEPSIGLEPHAVAQVFEMLEARQHADGLSILMVEQNVRQGLAFADLGYALVGGRLVAAGRGSDLQSVGAIGELFLGR